MEETQTNDESMMNSKKPSTTNGQVELQVMRIFDEDFNWYEECGDWFVEHPKWSLVGMGSTLQDAHRDLINELQMTQELFCDIPDEELTEEAKRMKRWLKPLRFKNSA